MIKFIAYLHWGFVGILIMLYICGEYWPIFVLTIIVYIAAYFIVDHIKYKKAMKRLLAYKPIYEKEHEEELSFVREFEKKYKENRALILTRLSYSELDPEIPYDDYMKYHQLTRFKSGLQIEKDRFGRYHVNDLILYKEIMKDGSKGPIYYFDYIDPKHLKS